MTASLQPVKAAVSADDLFSRSDAEFVACAYATLLHRPADPEGFLHYLLQLRRDGDKYAVVHALCTSEEGRLCRPNLPGLLGALACHRVKQLPAFRQIVGLRKSARRRTPVAAADTAEAQSLDSLDPAWYVKTYPAIVSAGLGPREHFDRLGKAQGLLPNAAAARRLLIDPQAYLDAYPDVAQAGMDPWEHYALLGRAEGRVAGISLRVLQFDRDWYLKRNPDVAVAGVDPFEHFAEDGIVHGRDSSSFKSLADIEPEPFVYTDPLATPEVKLVAFYLPQFQPAAEDHGGEEHGFTEWSNVSLAQSFYAEHDQPRLPGDLRCHDRFSSGVMKKQAELARSHGIYGFCFHFYWLGGNPLLGKPVEQFLADSSIDISFCFFCASENWTHRWDDQDQDVSIAQNHRPADDLAFIEEVARAFADPRYIRVDDKPLLVIYRPELWPDTRSTVVRWRDWCRANGVGEIHLCSPRAFGSAPPSMTGMDATIEFPPATGTNQEITPAVPARHPAFTGQINSYLVAAKAAGGYVRGSDLEYRGVMPGWDNTARRMERGISFYGSTPELYSDWLNHALEETRCNLPVAHRLVFVNAWNDWGEGAYLEPDGRHGHAYLNRTREALAAFATPVVNDANLRAKAGRTGRVAVVVHLHYGDLFDAIAEYLDNVPEAFDLYFSVRDGSFSRMQQLIHARFPQATVVSYPNRGRDVLPFLHILACIHGFGYDAICKVHAKKSGQRVDGDRWRDDLLAKLLGSRARVTDILDKLRGGVGLIVAAGHLLPGAAYCGSNKRRVAQFAERMGCPASWTRDFRFPAGTMFWCKPEVLAPLFDLSLSPDDFEPEAGQVDGTTAHAFERLVGLSARKSGLPIVTTDDTLEDDSISYPFAAPSSRHA